MGFLNTRFPDRIARGAQGGHGFWDVSIATTATGREARDNAWSMGRGRWSVAHALRSDEDFEEIQAHFYMARSTLHGFRFKDWTDYRVTQAQGRLVLVTGTTYQLHRVYGDDPAYEYLRPITRPVDGTVTVYVDDVAVVATPDPDTGRVTVAGGGTLLQWAGEFDVPARYDVKGRNATLVHRQQGGRTLIAWDQIDIVELREDAPA